MPEIRVDKGLRICGILLNDRNIRICAKRGLGGFILGPLEDALPPDFILYLKLEQPVRLGRLELEIAFFATGPRLLNFLATFACGIKPQNCEFRGVGRNRVLIMRV